MHVSNFLLEMCTSSQRLKITARWIMWNYSSRVRPSFEWINADVQERSEDTSNLLRSKLAEHQVISGQNPTFVQLRIPPPQHLNGLTQDFLCSGNSGSPNPDQDVLCQQFEVVDLPFELSHRKWYRKQNMTLQLMSWPLVLTWKMDRKRENVMQQDD